MKTELQQRRDELDGIIRLCGLTPETDRVLIAQLESFSSLAVSVAHRLIMRADNGLATYWRERAESAEKCVALGAGAVN